MQGVYERNLKKSKLKKEAKLLLMLEQLPVKSFTFAGGPGGSVWFVLIP